MHTILRGIVGSHAYGLNHAASDTDRLAIHQNPTKEVLGLRSVAAQDQTLVPEHPEGDLSSHELSKAVSLGYELLEIRSAFMSKRMVATYGGYAKAQGERLIRRGDGSFSSDTRKRQDKHARHLVRLMLQGTEALRTGEIRVRLDEEQVALCRHAEGLSPEDLMIEFERLDVLMKHAAAESSLPAEPDFKTVNDTLVQIRCRQLVY
jgi:uncharacterized protein